MFEDICLRRRVVNRTRSMQRRKMQLWQRELTPAGVKIVRNYISDYAIRDRCILKHIRPDVIQETAARWPRRRRRRVWFKQWQNYFPRDVAANWPSAGTCCQRKALIYVAADILMIQCSLIQGGPKQMPYRYQTASDRSSPDS